MCNSDLAMKITSGSLKDQIGSLPRGKYAGYYSAGATDTPSSWGTFEANVIDATSATIIVKTSVDKNSYATQKNSNGWSDWERFISNSDLIRYDKVIVKRFVDDFIARWSTLPASQLISTQYAHASTGQTYSVFGDKLSADNGSVMISSYALASGSAIRLVRSAGKWYVFELFGVSASYQVP